MHTIKEAKYEGYLWWSDSKKPVVYYGTDILSLQFDDNDNPFIIEGNLWDKERRISIYIRYVDGKHIIRHSNVTTDELKGIDDRKLNGDNISYPLVATTIKNFIAHRIPGVKELRFLQYWETATDNENMCEGMVALQPSKLVFIGFKKDEK